ncbi:non-ribosomal peptide synthetase [Micromonospora sp. WMMD1082]|uniref:non-ribosomal peptide synthetase n=1 Tax=Micromonospora sp. WMMD1082 TaxID=3016104 RepID=UPI002417A6A3|nr:non-ribosomal peptide synthetase [Micromonospora sp. WMMD1082]MDG4797010.1 amino acid adenylation domain-containing protein [Micromonospora sp. WMMD1082]
MLRRLAGSLGEPEQDLIRRRPDDTGPVPLSHLQEHLWFLDRLTPGTSTYNLGATFRLRGRLDVGALCASLHHLIGRHEALRTTVVDRDGRPVQVVHDTGGAVTVVDLSHTPAAERAATAARWAREAVDAPFDLDREPLFRASVAVVGPRDYLLALTMHHICVDGWSAQTLVTELTELYRAAVTGVEPALAVPQVHYPDFALWQRGRPDDTLTGQLDYWQETLRDLPTLSIPTDFPRPAVPSDRSDSVTTVLRGAVVPALREVSRRRGATLFMTLIAAFDAVLSRYTGQDDIVIGTTTTGRHHPQLEQMIGHFVNMVVLRTRVGGNPTFDELLDRVQRTVLGAWRHQDVPFEKVVAAVRPEREAGRNPLFQVGLQLLPEAAVGAPLDLPEVTASLVEAGLDRHPFDLSLTVREAEEALHISADFRTDLFAAPRIERLVTHLCTVLEAVAADSSTVLGELPVLTPIEREQVLEAWQGARRPYLREPVHRQIAAQAARTPRTIALRHGDDQITYRELVERADRLAGYLRGRAVGHEDVVAVGLERGIDTVVAFLAVMNADAAFLPLDLAHPPNRLAYQLDDAGAKVVVSHSRVRHRLPERTGWEPVWLDLDAAAIDAAPKPAGPSPVTESSLVYVLYTAGSTGRPKGVLIEHGALSNFVSWMTGVFELGPGDQMLQYAAVNFDLAEGEIFSALTSGATLVLAPESLRSDPSSLSGLIEAEGITYLGAPPAVLSLIPPADHPLLRKILVGGEALPGDLVNRWRAPGRRFVNGYGPTEITIGCSYYVCEHREWRGQPPIGRAMPNRFVYVLDRFDQPTPIGVPGEITVGGVGLARGYLNAPELTAARFVPNPFRPGELMYRTGDLGIWSETGHLQFLGRIDTQVKLRGVRIELTEIEACLASHPDVRRATVLLRTDLPGGPRLVAYLVPGSRVPDEAELRAHLARDLPANVVPGSYVMLDELPLTTVGKIDHAALPAPHLTGGRAPRTEPERVLCELFAEVLGVDEISVDDSFFDLGGYSLLVVRLVNRVRERLGVELEIRTIFDTPTVAGMAHHLTGDHAAGRHPVDDDQPPPLVAVEPLAPDAVAAADTEPVRGPASEPVTGPVSEPDTAGDGAAAEAAPGRPDRLPLSYAQRRLWFLAQMEGPTATYNVPMALRLTGPLDPQALRAALDDVVARHEVLRTVFPSVDGEPVQQIIADAHVPLVRPDVAPEQLPQLLADAAGTVFDLATDLPIRAWLLPTGPQEHEHEHEHVLMLVLHHIASDGLSLLPLLTDLGVAYTARRGGQAPTWRPLPMQYADHTLRQRAQLGDVTDPDSPLGRQLAYWKRTLAQLPPALPLPADRPRPAVASYRGDLLTFPIGAELHARLLHLTQRHRVSMFMLFQAAFAALLTRLGAGTDIPVGAPTAGRPEAELDALVGFFVNTLVLRTDTAGDPSFGELLTRVRDTDLAAFAHQDLPFELLAEALNPPRTAAHHPLFQVVLQVNSGGAGSLPPLGDVTVTAELVDLHVAKFDLVLGAEESYADGRPAGILGSFEYATDLFDRDTVHRLALRLVHLLDSVSRDPAQPLDAMDLFLPGERDQVLEEFNRTGHPVPDAVLPDLFEAQVDRSPGAPAVVADTGTVSYAALDEAANRLAHQLIAHGVTPAAIVAVAIPRRVELMVALYAVHKAGAAYLPLEIDHPAERLRYAVRHSRPTVVLTTSDVKLPDLDVPVVALDDPRIRTELASRPATRPARTLHTRHPAYVIYTSGSTGQPKAVVVSHHAIVNRLCWMQHHHPLGATDRVLQKTPAGFDVSVPEFFGPLQVGAALVLAAPGEQADPGRLAARIREGGVTVVHFVPSMLRAFLAEPAAATCTGLRRVFVSGEELPAVVQRRFHQLLDAELHNLYGPTEATVEITAWHCHPGDAGPVPIGRPVWNSRLYVLDGHLNPLPIGVTGELYLAGRQLADGYQRQPALTAQRFLPDPYGPAGARMYRSGDLARWRTDGALEFMGRADDQMKIRGLRIEPQEVEEALTRHTGVAHAAVAARPAPDGGAQLIGYLVPDPATEPVMHRLATLRAAESLPWQPLPDGTVVAAPDRATATFLHRELFEDGAVSPARLDLPPGACVFDVGAHVGMFSLALHRAYPDAVTYAFEPVPALHEMLEVNTTLYGVPARTFAYGLGETDGEVDFTYYPHLSVMSGRYADTVADARIVEAYEGVSADSPDSPHWRELLDERLRPERLTVALRTLSAVLDETAVPRVDLLKIDVERGELDVLRGIRDEHWPLIRQVLVETDDTDGRADDLTALLIRHGFAVTRRTPALLAGTGLVSLHAVRPEDPPPSPRPAQVGCPRSEAEFVADVRDETRHVLPEHLVPQRFVLLDRLPLSTNGKLDRSRLPEPGRGGGTGRAPRTREEEIACGVVADLLRLDRVTIDDNFFDLGGHSLLTVQLVNRIAAATGRQLSVRSVFVTPTVAGLLSGGPEHGGLDVLLPLRSTGSREPLFCVHPFTGLSWGYAGLARHLGPDRPLYGLQSPLLTDPDAAARDIAALAEEYLGQIRAVAPRGPYHLLGWSFGGLVAQEIAVRLRERGEQVGVLALLDAYPVPQQGAAAQPPTPAEVLGVLTGDPELSRTDSALSALPDDEELARLVRGANPALAQLRTGEIAALARAAASHLDAMRHHVPRRYDGEVLFVTATEGRPEDAPTADTWQPYVGGGLARIDVAATHWTMTEPAPLAEIGEVLRQRLGDG